MSDYRESDYTPWLGRRRTAQDVVGAAPIEGLAALLDIAPPTELPPAWHWLYFLATPPQAALGGDGVEARGDFLPPIDLPRRMWAGGRFEFHRQVRAGERIERVSTIQAIERKSGKRGPLVFVTVRHEISGGRGLAVTEEQTIVFRAAAAAGETALPQPAPATAQWRRAVTPDPVLLFRFSALTFNAHRIHYDRPYATGVEGYPGLVVHGPLQALLLLESLRGEADLPPVRRFDYRALGAIFDTGAFTVNGARDGDEVRLWTADADGNLGMMGIAGF
jgi:3-methylfumaryl-CoA hydratase